MNQKSYQLYHIFVLFRHGDRSPVSKGVEPHATMTPNDLQYWISKLPDLNELDTLNIATTIVPIHDNQTNISGNNEQEKSTSPRSGGKWPLGQLTNIGTIQMQLKGQDLYHKYKDFFSKDEFQPIQHTYVLSTNVRRTVRSAQCVLRGLFPSYFDVEDRKRNEIPKISHSFIIHTDTRNALAPLHTSESFKAAVYQWQIGIKDISPKYVEETKEQLQKLLDIDPNKLFPWLHIHDLLVCRRAHDLPFPAGIDENLFHNVKKCAGWLWHALYKEDKFCLVSFQTGIARMFEHLEHVEKGTINCKLSLFSGHDTSLIAFTNVLKLQLPPDQLIVPPYGSMIIMEMYKDMQTNEMFVRMKWNDDYISIGDQTNDFIPFSYILERVQSFLSGDASVSSL